MLQEPKKKSDKRDSFLFLYWDKLKKIISDENDFFVENPHLKSFRTILVATIIVIFYVGVLTLASKGLSALLSLLKIPYNNYIAVGITLVTLTIVTWKDIKNNPITKKKKKKTKKKRGIKMGKKAWFGLDPRLELLIAATIIFAILVWLGIIPLK